MSKFSNSDDEKLVAFLRQNCPFAPPEKTNLEEQLMEQIEGEPLLPRPSLRFIDSIRKTKLAVFTAASFLLAWSGYSFFTPSPRIAIYSNELDTFLVNSWNGALGDTSFVFQTETLEEEWQLINKKLKKTSSVYNH